MIKDLHKTEYGVEGKAPFKLFDCEIDVMIDDDCTVEYAEKCVEAMNDLPEDAVAIICKAAKKYCMWFIEEVGECINDELTVPIYADTPAREILNNITPSMLIVETPKDSSIGYHIECGCDWEIEHGLEITIKDNKVLYVGDFGDNGAWDKYPENNEWNFVNLIRR